jgi:ribonuclease PH
LFGVFLSVTRKKRKCDELRPVFLGPGFSMHAHGSCFVKYGNTHVICTATIEERVPPFLRNSGTGWITAQYGMLPCSTNERIEREAFLGRQNGRTQEIQRLIGRAIRPVIDLKILGERQVRLDCDVIQADGGTRTASITGAYVALHYAIERLMNSKKIYKNPLIDQVVAVSCGVVNGEALLDLDFMEDSNADVDGNFIITKSGKIIEIQMCAEKEPFSEKQFQELINFAKIGCNNLLEIQTNVLKKN